MNGHMGQALREAFQNSPELSALVSSAFGAPRTNNYGKVGRSYKRSDIKPDKKYSMLPTVLKLAGNCRGKIILDLGCGSGFFTFPLAELGALSVVGIDNSSEQLELARARRHPISVRWHNDDIFTSQLPCADLIVAPFVVNYATDTKQLEWFIRNLKLNLSSHGRVILILDTPSGKNLKRFGAQKIPLGPDEDGTRIQIDLFRNSDTPICRLHSTYFRTDTVKRLLKVAGFKKVHCHQPVISDAGLMKMGTEYWRGYLSNPELTYLTAENPQR